MVFTRALFDHTDADLDRYVEDVLAGSPEGESFRKVVPDTEPNVLLHRLARMAMDFSAHEAPQVK